mmetsp:Transcript_9994/g.12711  ORF Transcript_9994/g.12711 Transcript_9994/m.12711 type:complete len:530 (-) Transcript_9994:133-1722(-)
MDKLPDRWYCELNKYDPKRNSCNAPEQTTDEILRERRKAKKKRAAAAIRTQISSESQMMSKDEPGTTRLSTYAEDQSPFAEKRTMVRGGHYSRGSFDSQEQKISRSSSIDDTAESDLDSTDGDSSKSSGGSKTSQASEKSTHNQSRSSNIEDNSQSEGSAKRNSNQGSSVGSIKKSKSVDDPVGLDVVATTKSKNSSRNRNRPRSNKDSDKNTKSSKSNKQNSKEAESQNWVQCEKCEKWRRLPPRICAEDLPDVWYCSMNTWDVNSASCTAEEDKLDTNVREYTITAGANLNGPSTNSGKLSYRSLIFGTGRKQNRPISERTRAAESLFSTLTDQSTEGNAPPTVMYANSSAFQYKGSHIHRQTSSIEENSKSNFLDLMSQSHLWAELYGGAYAIQALRQEQPLFKSNEDFVRSIKALVYHAIGNSILAGHEVLLNVQCINVHESCKEWIELRASCTLELIIFALEELVKEDLVKTIRSSEVGECGVDMIRFCRTNADGATHNCRKVMKHSRCMKIAKPWKKAGVGST